MRKIELKEDDFKNSYRSFKTSVRSIKKILLDEGYTEAQIKYMRMNGMILLTPNTYAAKLKEGQTILVMDEPPRAKVKTGKSTRFANIGLEEEE